MNNRNVSIYLFRAFSIISITGRHVLPFIGNPTKLFYVWNLYGPFAKGVGVALFVFIAGYLNYSPASPFLSVDFIKRKLKRIVIPYYVALLVWNILILSGVMPIPFPNLIDNVTHLLFVHNLSSTTFYSISGVFWFQGLIIQLYILYVLLRPWVVKHSLAVGVVSFIVCLAVNIHPFFDFPGRLQIEVINKSVFSYGFLFFLGMIVKERADKIIPYLQKPQIFYSLIVLSMSWLFLNNYLTQYDELEKQAVGFLLGLVMLGMPKISEDNMILRPFILIGEASYSIYLYNYIFGIFKPHIFGIEGLICYSLITIFFGMAAYRFIEEPLLKRKDLSMVSK